MLTPFNSEYAEKYISEILQTLDEKQYPDAVAFLIQMTIQNYDDCQCTDLLGLQKCYELWTACCLLDAVLNHTDYMNDCRNYSDKYLQVISSLEEGFQKTKRKLFKKLPVYHQSRIAQTAFDALTYLTVPDYDDLSPEDVADIPRDEKGDFLTQLGGIMQKEGKLEQWDADVMELSFRLLDNVEDNDKNADYYNSKGILK
ncbi:MAG: hypothetical protein IJJ69_04910 [Oscillospiraceae bacterium]|nr:hypothetical protein [Oscillospiraceae bacterium]